MTEQYRESAGDGRQDEVAAAIEEMWQVGPETDGVVVNVEDAAVRPSSSESPRPDGSAYVAPKPTDEQVIRAAEHGFDLGSHRDKYYN